MTRFSLCIFVCLLFLPVSGARGQGNSSGCTTNVNAPPISGYHWPRETEVKVYFGRSIFTSEQKTTLLAAMDQWTKAATTAGAGVRFIYSGEMESRISCPSQTRCLTVMRNAVHKWDRKHYAAFFPVELDKSGQLLSAWIDFDFATTNAKALQGFMAHELGHGMGLWDCTSCKKKQSIMNSFSHINRDNGSIAPSVCDRETVRKVYESARQAGGNHANEKGDNHAQ